MAQVNEIRMLMFSDLIARPPELIARFWQRLEEIYPSLRSEYVQVLALVVVPLIILFGFPIADLTFRRRTQFVDGAAIFRPSIAVRLAWLLAIMALVANLLFSRHHWIVVAANVLALIELVRTFPRDLNVTPEGLRWHEISGQVCVTWEQISCFTQKRSLFGTECKLCSNDGRTFVINSMIFPEWKQIFRRISLSLAQHHLVPSATTDQTALEKLHRILAPACLLLIVLGDPFFH